MSHLGTYWKPVTAEDLIRFVKGPVLHYRNLIIVEDKLPQMARLPKKHPTTPPKQPKIATPRDSNPHKQPHTHL